MVKPNPEILCADPLNAAYDADYRAAPGAEVPRAARRRIRPRTALGIGLSCLAVALAVGVWWLGG